jgi:predicted phage tail protein
VSGDTVVLSWTAPASGGAPLSYVIAAGAFSGSSDFVQDTGSLATSFTASGVASGTYFVRVVASNGVGLSASSNEVIVSVTAVGGPGATPASGAPGTPGGLRAHVNGSTVALSWAPGSGGAPQSYWIDAGSSSGLSDLASFATGSSATSIAVPGVPAGTYYVRVRASNSLGSSAPSNEVIVFVSGLAACSAPPDTPIGLHASVTGSTVTLGWSAPAGGPTSYVVEAGSQSGGADLVVTDSGSTSTAMVATGVGSGVYFVRVRARNACGTSGGSNEAVIVVP